MSPSNKLLILEGLHGVGKSTLAASFVSEPRTAVFHFDAPWSTDPYYEYLRPIVMLDGWNVVYDRGHLGELVWSKIFGRIPIIKDVAMLHQVETALQEAASHIEIWWLLGDGSMNGSRARENASYRRGLTREQIDTAYLLYNEAIQATSLPTLIIEWEELDEEVKRWKSV